MNNKTQLCDKCNAEIITIRRGQHIIAECSYCGESTEDSSDDYNESEEL